MGKCEIIEFEYSGVGATLCAGVMVEPCLPLGSSASGPIIISLAAHLNVHP